MLKIVFLSNFFNHHQKPLSDALYTHQNVKYFFIATSQMPAERKQLGYHMSELPEYVLTAYNDKQREAVQTLIYDADIVIVGSAPERMLRERIRCGKLIFRYSERPLKKGMSYIKFLPRVFKWNLQNPFWKPIYMLCASAYTASDYAKHGAFVHKCYKWGYFPETKCYYDVSSFMAEKDKTAILWAGRFLKWKHPDDAIEIARRLKNDGYKYSLTVVGCGEMESELKVKIAEYGLHEYVRLAGAMPPEQVRKHMEKSGIYLFTSDRNEGWGAVLNEAMNSGCAVVGCREIGAVPYLIQDGINGLVYEKNDVNELYEKVKLLLDNTARQQELGINAYKTIVDLWNAEMAAKRFICTAQQILDGVKKPQLYKNGPCSYAT